MIVNIKPKVLICEDDPDLTEIMELLLLQQRYDVKSVDNCEDILDTLDQFKADLVLMDLRIPVMGGERAVMMLRGMPQYKDLPIVIVSANQEISQVASKVNATDYIAKPFDINNFKQKVQAALPLQ